MSGAKLHRVVESLKAKPELLFDVGRAIGGIRVAGPWKEGRTQSGKLVLWREHPTNRHRDYKVDEREAVAVFEAHSDYWTYGFGETSFSLYDTHEEAVAAADAYLVKQGWTLLGGQTEADKG